MIGQAISHYKILEKLGEGGMGVVYKAQDTKLNRTVALKFLPEHISASESDTARFMQEAQAAASLNHPNICTIHGIEEADRKHFIVMEFVDGQMLQEKKSSLSIKQALDIGIQIAEGLAAAHEKGIVHRDIKPENIMIRKDGLVQIMDFGLAKLRGASRLTKEGSTVGTAGYMSPEQVQGQETDHRSDIFSLGVLLYEMFTGQPPFKGMHETAISYEIVNVDSPPMSSLKPEIPPELDDIVLECLEKEKSDRCQSAAEVAKDLRRHKRESGRSRTFRSMSGSSASINAPPDAEPLQSGRGPKTFTTRERMIWAGVVVVIAAIAGYLVIQTYSVKPPEKLSTRFLIKPPENSSIYQTVASPDGKMIAFTTRDVKESKASIWIRRLSALEPEPVPGTENARYPFWSPDSRFIGFFADGKLKKVDVSSGATIDLCEAPQAFGGSWSLEDEVLFASLGNIFRVSGKGGVPAKVAIQDPWQNRGDYRWPVFLPDGKKFLFIEFGSSEIRSKTFIGSLEDSIPKELLESLANTLFAPPSHVLFLRGRTLLIQAFDMNAGTLLDEAKPLAVDVGTSPLEVLGDFSYSGAGVLTTGGGRAVRREYRWFDRSGRSTEAVVDPGNYFDIALTPSQKQAALQGVSDQNGNSDLWMVDLTRKVTSRFTFDLVTNDDPTWSPDGKYLFFSNTRTGQYSVYRKLATGLGEPEEVTPPLPISQIPSDISPDGINMLYLRGPRGNMDVWVMNLKSKEQYPFIATPFDETFAEFSPDGKWVVYASNASGRSEVFVRSFSTSGGRWQISRAGGSQPHWRQDGRELFFIAPDIKLMSVTVREGKPITFDTPAPLFQTRIDLMDGPKRFAVADNGRRFLINVPIGEAYANPVTVTINPEF